MNEPIGSLQHQYLSNLLECNKSLTIKQALYRMSILNETVATIRLQLKDIYV